MITVTSGDVFLGILMILLNGGLGALVWARLNRIEDRLVYLSDRMATRDEVASPCGPTSLTSPSSWVPTDRAPAKASNH